MQAAAVVNRAPPALCRAGILPATTLPSSLPEPGAHEWVPYIFINVSVLTLNYLNSLIRRRAAHTRIDSGCLRALHL